MTTEDEKPAGSPQNPMEPIVYIRMPLRDAAALAALPAIIQIVAGGKSIPEDGVHRTNAEWISEQCYDLADAMLAARSKP